MIICLFSPKIPSQKRGVFRRSSITYNIHVLRSTVAVATDRDGLAVTHCSSVTKSGSLSIIQLLGGPLKVLYKLPCPFYIYYIVSD
jgi:hypothetical protein